MGKRGLDDIREFEYFGFLGFLGNWDERGCLKTDPMGPAGDHFSFSVFLAVFMFFSVLRGFYAPLHR